MSGRRVWCGAGDGELGDGQPFVACRIGPVHEAHEVAAGFAVALVLHRHAGDQQPMEAAVGGQHHRRAEVDHLAHGIVARGGRHFGVQGRNGSTQPVDQQHLPIVVALRRRPVGCEVRPVPVLPPYVGQPAQRFPFELVFRHGQRASKST